MAQRYAYVALSDWDLGAFRIQGPGLGNLLFPWARAVVAARRDNLQILWPTWTQFKLGPILRREKDARFYSGLFENPGHYVDGFKKLRLLLSAGRLNEHTQRSTVPLQHPPSGDELICFAGMQDWFEPFINERALVRDELINIAQKRHLDGMSFDFSQSISVHLRLGDFKPFENEQMRAGSANMRLPIRWIIDTIETLRAQLGQTRPVWVFSDGSDADLAELLALANTQRVNFGSALGDLIAMSQSEVLVVSSSFSMWSSYLGDVPSIYYPGQLRRRLLPQAQGREIELDTAAKLPQTFLDHVQTKQG